jgi:methylenetetrahydrofolate dehydrogenase (NADP+)/methenyltetrahydrofolate cyclohydrolase
MFWLNKNKMQIIDGRKIKEKILEDIKREVMELPFVPVLCDILVGDDKVSKSYVSIKEKSSISTGFKFRRIELPFSSTTEDIIREIQNLNNVPHMCGIIVQLPLPSHIDERLVLDSVAKDLDVDCLGREASDDFYNNKEGSISYPTAKACITILDSLDLDLSDKKIVVIGKGKLVGKPVSHLLENRGLKVEKIDSNTFEKENIIKQADIIFSGVGKDKFIKKSMIKEGVVIIDAGTSEENGTIYGDVDFEEIYNVPSFITPCPGGVGPVTVAMLLANVLEVAKNKSKWK